MNDRSFEDCERTLEEIKSLFFNILNLWTAAFVFQLVIIISLFILLLLARCFLLYTSYVLGGILHF
jgi:hypothetical protein